MKKSPDIFPDRETQEMIADADRIRMPFGRFGPKNFPPDGVPVCDLPYEYLAWFKTRGYPRGRLGLVMEFVCDLKADGADILFDPLRKIRGGKTSLRRQPPAGTSRL